MSEGALNPYSDIIEKLRNVAADADGADLRALAAQIRTQVPESNNPKDRIGQAKVSLTKIPGVALLHEAKAMMNGASRYGAFNWRDHSVLASIYVDAALRHLYSWFEGEEEAQDSGVHHLGHLRACTAILLDAQATGNLVDDRPKKGTFISVLSQLNEQVKK
jgi:hypothetical protein